MDWVIAAVVLTVILVSFVITWITGMNRLSYFEQERWREEAARSAIEQLLETPGYPTHWDKVTPLTENNIRSIGLAKSRNLVSQSKLMKLMGLQSTQYSFAKKIMGLQRYNVSIVVKDLGGDDLYSFNAPPPTDKRVSAVSRLALLETNLSELSGSWTDTFCVDPDSDGIWNSTERVNYSQSVGVQHLCDDAPPISGIGLNHTYEEAGLSDGASMMNVSVPAGGTNSTLRIKVPMGINLTEFYLNLTGIMFNLTTKKPVGAVLVTDRSGSMDDNCGLCSESTCTPSANCNDANGCKICDLKRAAKTFVATILNGSQPDKTQIGLASYEDVGVRDYCMSNNSASLNSTIDTYIANGCTCFVCGMNLSVQLLMNNYTETNRIMLLMSDGLANTRIGTCSGSGCSGTVNNQCSYTGSTCSSESLAKAQAENYSTYVGSLGIKLYTIAFGPDADNATLEQMAANANGVSEGYFYFAPDGATLAQIYERIATEISSYGPENVTVDVGMTGSAQWEKNGSLGSSYLNIAPWIMELLRDGCAPPSCPGCELVTEGDPPQDYCYINISLYTPTGGTIQVGGVLGHGAYTSGHAMSIEITPNSQLTRWDRYCVSAFNTLGVTHIDLLVLNGTIDPATGLYNLAECTDPGCPQTILSNGEFCFDISELDITRHPKLVLYANLFSDNVERSPIIDVWNVAYFYSTSETELDWYYDPVVVNMYVWE
jgi:hypothetical protein